MMQRGARHHSCRIPGPRSGWSDLHQQTSGRNLATAILYRSVASTCPRLSEPDSSSSSETYSTMLFEIVEPTEYFHVRSSLTLQRRPRSRSTTITCLCKIRSVQTLLTYVVATENRIIDDTELLPNKTRQPACWLCPYRCNWIGSGHLLLRVCSHCLCCITYPGNLLHNKHSTNTNKKW